MTMKDLFKDDDDMQDNYEDVNPEQPQLTDGEEEQPQEGVYDDGTGIMQQQGGDLSVTPSNFKYADRFIKVRGMPNPKKNSNEESNFILSNDFSEQLILNFLSDSDQRKIWRSLADIVDESEGSGNVKVASTDAKLLASRIMMKRASTENALALNERSAHITQLSKSNITTKTNQIRAPANSGWLSRLFGH